MGVINILVWRLRNIYLHLTARVFSNSAISPFLGKLQVMCCSELQCIAVYCSVLQCVAICCNVS